MKTLNIKSGSTKRKLAKVTSSSNMFSGFKQKNEKSKYIKLLSSKLQTIENMPKRRPVTSITAGKEGKYLSWLNDRISLKYY